MNIGIFWYFYSVGTLSDVKQNKPLALQTPYFLLLGRVISHTQQDGMKKLSSEVPWPSAFNDSNFFLMYFCLHRLSNPKGKDNREEHGWPSFKQTSTRTTWLNLRSLSGTLMMYFHSELSLRAALGGTYVDWTLQATSTSWFLLEISTFHIKKNNKALCDQNYKNII